MMSAVEAWERAWADYVAVLERWDRAAEQTRVSRRHNSGARRPRVALARARARVEKLAPGFLARLGPERRGSMQDAARRSQTRVEGEP
jgi:hypothetical protein